MEASTRPTQTVDLEPVDLGSPVKIELWDEYPITDAPQVNVVMFNGDDVPPTTLELGLQSVDHLIETLSAWRSRHL